MYIEKKPGEIWQLVLKQNKKSCIVFSKYNDLYFLN